MFLVKEQCPYGSLVHVAVGEARTYVNSDKVALTYCYQTAMLDTRDDYQLQNAFRAETTMEPPNCIRCITEEQKARWRDKHLRGVR